MGPALGGMGGMGGGEEGGGSGPGLPHGAAVGDGSEEPQNPARHQPALPGVSPAPTPAVERLLELRNRELLVSLLPIAGIGEVSLLVFPSCDVTESTAKK